jgi:hypothetical protein
MAAGKKHTLVIYNRTMDRLWRGTIVLALELIVLWWFGKAFTSLYRPEIAPIMIGAAGYATAFGLFAFFVRNKGYVRAFDDYLLVATPFYRFKTSYKRIRGIRSVDFHRLFTVEDRPWAERRYSRPMIGETAVVVKLKKYPVSPNLINAFFHTYLINPGETELVLLVPDWMDLSVELDSRYNKYRQRQGNKARRRALRG